MQLLFMRLSYTVHFGGLSREFYSKRLVANECEQLGSLESGQIVSGDLDEVQAAGSIADELCLHARQSAVLICALQNESKS